MNAELREAVESLSREIADPEDCTAWHTILSALRGQEAEIGMLQDVADTIAELYQHELLKSEKAEALLRECHARLSTYHPADQRLANRIITHLSENSRG